MSAIYRGLPGTGRSQRQRAPRPDDPRVIRSRAAVTAAARTLFLEKGYSATTIDEIAARAGLTKRTVYNNYKDKQALFTLVVGETITYAEGFARTLRAEFAKDAAADGLASALHDIARRLALAILRPEIIALRRLIVREADAFPQLAAEYYSRAPGQVIGALASEFHRLSRIGVLRVKNSRTAAEQFAYLVVGEPLDRAILTGALPTQRHALSCAKEAVETFLARYAAPPGRVQPLR